MTYKTLKDILRINTEQFSGDLAFQIKRDDKYIKYTFHDVRHYATGLIEHLKMLGVNKGDKVAILSENRPEWGISYLAVTSMGATAIPLDSLGAEFDLKGIIKHSESKVIITSSKFLETMSFPELIVVNMDKDFNQMLAHSSYDLGYETSEDDIASIVYTSGTTGIPKGVMLTNRNITTNVATVCSLFDITNKDMMLSVLPMHHTFETTAGLLAPFFCGASVTYAESLKSSKLIQNMNEVHPTIFIGVPLLYQIFYDGIMREVDEKGPAFKFIFNAMMFISRISGDIFRIKIGKHLFSMLHKKFGGAFRFWVTGGAGIDPELLKAFDRMGFIIIQGYGLTESSPIITANNLGANKYGSAGQAIPGVTVKIINNEIVTSGPNIMAGYYKMKEETDKVLRDGVLYTGDVGHLDKDGFLYITGRIKDVIISSSGVNVYPDEIEFELLKIPYIKDACVIGRKIASGIKKGSEEVFAVVAPNIEYFEKMGLSTSESAVHNAVQESMDKLNDKLPLYKRVAGFYVRSSDFPRTSTKKIKRFVVRREMDEVWRK